MKRKLMFPIVVLAMVFCSMGIAMAANHNQSYTGKVLMVDPVLRVLIIKSHSVEHTFHLDRKSTVNFEGHASVLGELHRGDEVTVTMKNPGVDTNGMEAGQQ